MFLFFLQVRLLFFLGQVVNKWLQVEIHSFQLTGLEEVPFVRISVFLVYFVRHVKQHLKIDSDDCVFVCCDAYQNWENRLMVVMPSNCHLFSQCFICSRNLLGKMHMRHYCDLSGSSRTSSVPCIGLRSSFWSRSETTWKPRGWWFWIPKQSMGLVYLPTFTIKIVKIISQMWVTWMIWDMLPHWWTFKMPVPFKTVCCLYTWTFQFGCQMVPLCVNSPFFRDLFWHPDWKVRLYVFQDMFSISLSIYLTCDLSHHPTSLTMINSLDLKGRCPMTSLQKNWKLRRRPHVFFFFGGGEILLLGEFVLWRCIFCWELIIQRIHVHSPSLTYRPLPYFWEQFGEVWGLKS